MNRPSIRRKRLFAFGLVSVLALSASPALAAGGFTSATASGNDGNVPGNAVDGNLSTRWSSNGVGQWIRGDLGAVKSLTALDIAWYQGASRASKFVIATSADGTTFTQVFSGTSSGKTASFERYTFAAVNARYVRVTVNGNTSNTWASISEVAAITGTTSPTPTPEPTPTPDADAHADARVGHGHLRRHDALPDEGGRRDVVPQGRRAGGLALRSAGHHHPQRGWLLEDEEQPGAHARAHLHRLLLVQDSHL